MLFLEKIINVVTVNTLISISLTLYVHIKKIISIETMRGTVVVAISPLLS